MNTFIAICILWILIYTKKQNKKTNKVFIVEIVKLCNIAIVRLMDISKDHYITAPQMQILKCWVETFADKPIIYAVLLFPPRLL